MQSRLATPIVQPRMYFFDAMGKPLLGGKIHSFKVGTDEFKPTYRNAELTALNVNPIVLDQAGSALIYVRGSNLLKVYDKNGNFVETRIIYQQVEQTQFFDQYGKPLSNGKVWTYDYQSTILKPSYFDADNELLNTNPIELDQNGYASISIVGAYRLRSYDKNGVFVGDQDFKRLPVKALTAVVYSTYFVEGFAIGFALFGCDRRDIVKQGLSKSENCKICFSLLSATIRNILNMYQLNEDLTTSFCIVGAKVNNPLNSISIQQELISSTIMLKNAIKKDVLITNVMQHEPISTSFAIICAQIIN